jgi:hypothetical protein
MKIGSESRGKLIAAIVLMTLAVLMVGNWLFNSAETSSAVSPVTQPSDNALALADPAATRPAPARKVTGQKARRARSLDPTLRYDWLKESEDTQYKGLGRNIFQAQVDIPKPLKTGAIDHPQIAKVIPATPPPPPPPPPIELKFFGFVSRPGEPKKILLRQGNDIFPASEGDIVDRRYKVLRISPSSVEIEDVLNNNRQEIPLTQGEG